MGGRAPIPAAAPRCLQRHARARKDGRHGRRPVPQRPERTAGGDLVQLVVDYAKQETVGRVRGLGRFAVLGAPAAVLLSVGVGILLLALLRALQTETGSAFRGNLSWLPYLITAVPASGVVGFVSWRIVSGPARRARRTTERDA